jgi:hypothetical protein
MTGLAVYPGVADDDALAAIGGLGVDRHELRVSPVETEAGPCSISRPSRLLRDRTSPPSWRGRPRPASTTSSLRRTSSETTTRRRSPTFRFGIEQLDGPDDRAALVGGALELLLG